MTQIEIKFDELSWYFDACIPSLGIATQGTSLDSCIQNISEAISLSQGKDIKLTDFTLSCKENYVNF